MSISKIELFLCREIRNPHNTSHKLHYVMYYGGRITLLYLYIQEFFLYSLSICSAFLTRKFYYLHSYYVISSSVSCDCCCALFRSKIYTWYFLYKFQRTPGICGGTRNCKSHPRYRIKNNHLPCETPHSRKLLTLGISSLVISLFMVYLTDYLVTGISLGNIVTLIIVAVITSGIALLFRFFR